MRAVLFDTSLYIAALRSGDASALSMRRWESGSVVWVSAVVLEELYAGAGESGRHAVDRLKRDFERARRILVPSLTDWTEMGHVLSRLGAKYGYEKIGRCRLANDALLAISAGSKGIEVLTKNERDFRKLAEFWPFQWRVFGARSSLGQTLRKTIQPVFAKFPVLD